MSGNIAATGTICDGTGCIGSSQWTTSNSDIYYSTGNVGIGAAFLSASPAGPLEIHNGSNQLLLLDSGGGLTILGGLSEGSDVNTKENFSPVEGEEILARLAKIPIATWNFKANSPAARHMGPTAQDFYAAFGLGRDERHIAPLDTNGVALAAIQALHQMAQEKDGQIAQLQEQNAELEARLEKLEQLIETLGLKTQ